MTPRARRFVLPDGLEKKTGRRPARVADAIRNELLVFFQREVRDPRLAEVRVTEVVMSADLKTARVYYTCDEARRAEVGRGLERARGFVRTHIARTINLRYAPALNFRFDDRVDESMRLERILSEIGDDDGHGA
jgi:ribosome-binding factor A